MLSAGQRSGRVGCPLDRGGSWVATCSVEGFQGSASAMSSLMKNQRYERAFRAAPPPRAGRRPRHSWQPRDGPVRCCDRNGRPRPERQAAGRPWTELPTNRKLSGAYALPECRSYDAYLVLDVAASPISRCVPMAMTALNSGSATSDALRWPIRCASDRHGGRHRYPAMHLS
jgi:hypothetical protein